MVLTDPTAVRTRQSRRQASARAAIMAGFVLGAGLWTLSPLLTGTREPWDVEWPFYTIAMTTGGGLIRLLLPGRPVPCIGAIWFGQVLACAVLPGHDNSWLLLSVLSTGIGSLLSLAGYGFGHVLHHLFARRSGRPS